MSFTYLAHDLRTNAQLAELPLENVSFSTRLKGIGDFSADVPLSHNEELGFDPLDVVSATRPTRTAIYIDFDGQLVWGGIIWGRRFDSDSQRLSLSGGEFMSFFTHHFFHRDTGDINLPLRYVNTDQFTIFRGLMGHVLLKAGGNINIDLGTTLSGVLRDRTYRVTKYKQIYEAMDQLSNVINGFDYSIDPYYDASFVPQKRLSLAYPRRGVKGTNTRILWEFPGDILWYEWPEDGESMATRSHAQGAGEGKEMLRSYRTNTALIAAGWPLLEQQYTYTDITVQATLDGHAQSDLDANDQPVTQPKIRIPLYGDYPLNSFITGDHARIRILDRRFPDGLDERWRIIGWTVDTTQQTVEIEFGRVDPAL